MDNRYVVTKHQLHDETVRAVMEGLDFRKDTLDGQTYWVWGDDGEIVVDANHIDIRQIYRQLMQIFENNGRHQAFRDLRQLIGVKDD